MHHRLSLIVVIFVFAAGTFIAACGGSGDDDDGENGGGESANVENSISPEDEAQQVFIDTGCAECHGESGDGDGQNQRTALSGNKLFVLGQFQQRVRNGRGSDMPAYTPEQISDEQIALIFEWLTGQ